MQKVLFKPSNVRFSLRKRDDEHWDTQTVCNYSPFGYITCYDVEGITFVKICQVVKTKLRIFFEKSAFFMILQSDSEKQ
jgi:hypothetical protein